MEDFPSNRQTKAPVHPEKPEPKQKKTEKIISGDVIRRKKPMGRRFMENFFGGDARSVGSYIFLDVALPAAKNTIADMVSQGIEKTLFGEVRSTSRSGIRPVGSQHTAYSRISSRPSYGREEARPVRDRRARALHDFSDIILATRREAEEVLQALDAHMERYQTVSVGELYDLVGEERQYTDEKWGWVDLRDARIERIREGYLLDLPRPISID